MCSSVTSTSITYQYNTFPPSSSFFRTTCSNSLFYMLLPAPSPVQLVIYNADYDIFIMVRHSLIWRTGGNIKFETESTPFVLDDYRDVEDLERLVLELVILVILAINIISELRDWCKQGTRWVGRGAVLEMVGKGRRGYARGGEPVCSRWSFDRLARRLACGLRPSTNI